MTKSQLIDRLNNINRELNALRKAVEELKSGKWGFLDD